MPISEHFKSEIKIKISLEREKCLNNFQEHDFLRDLKFPPLFQCDVAGKKRAEFSNPVKNNVLESCSNILSPLELHKSNNHKVILDLWEVKYARS